MSNEKKNDGGYAFPSSVTPGGYVDNHGMTIRDYFASKAMQGIVQSMLTDGTKVGYDTKDPAHFQHIGQDAYAIADGMLKAREQ